METKKVGIVTFHTGNNYGANLQAYALQSYITHMGFNVKIMDFNPLVYDTYDRIFRKVGGGRIRNVYHFVCQLIHYSELRRRANRFEDFRNAFYKRTDKRYLTAEDFLRNHESFDYYVSGSDQVFNPNVSFSDCYFLAFDKNNGKKVAYAPSLGVANLSTEQMSRIKKHISDFDCLSCREENGAAVLSQLAGSYVPTVCDPVFLLGKDEWLNIASKVEEKRPYIFVYDLNGGHRLIELAKRVSDSAGIKTIICATTNTHSLYSGVKCLRSLGPKELLGYINEARYVITDSFHGTSLSLLLGTKVLPLISVSKTSSRIEFVMNKLGVGNQIVRDVNNFIINDITFEHYSDTLAEYISESKEFLKQALS